MASIHRGEAGPRVLVRLDARRNPNRQDHLMRVAQANQLRGIRALCRAVDSSYAPLVLLPAEQLNDFLVGGKGGANAAVQRGGQQGLRLAVQGLSPRARICPICIREGRFQSLTFNSALIVACPIHRVVVCDECPRCNGCLTYMRHDMAFCDCGFPLERLPASPLPRWLCLLHRELAPWHIARSPHSRTLPVAALDFRVGRLLHRLLWPTRGQTRRRRQYWLCARDIPVIAQFARRLPESFGNAVAAAMRNASDADRYTLLSAIAELEIPELSTAAVEATRQFGSTPAYATSKAYVSLNSVRRLAKLDTKAVHDLVRHDLTKGSARASRGNDGRLFYWISSVETERLSRLFATTMDVREAARRLGCEPFYVRALVNAELLPATFLHSKPRSPRITPTHVERFVSRLFRYAVSVRRAPVDTLALSSVPAYQPTTGYLRTWKMLMEHILLGKVPIVCFGRDGDLRSLHVSAGELRKFRSSGPCSGKRG